MPALILQTVQLQVSHIIIHIFTQEPGAKHRYKYGKYTRGVDTSGLVRTWTLAGNYIPSSTRIVQGRPQGIYGLGKGLQILLQTFNNSQWIENFRMGRRTFEMFCNSLDNYLDVFTNHCMQASKSKWLSHYTGCHLQQSIEQSGTCLGLGNLPCVRLCTRFALPLKIILYRDMFLSIQSGP